MLYDAAMALFETEGATVVDSDIFSASWTDKYYAQPNAPNSQRFDQWKYFQNLGATTPFDSWETYQAELTAQGKVFVNSAFVTETTDTVDTRTTPAGVAWLAWQQYTISTLGSPTPQVIKAADLIARGPGKNVNVTVTDFEFLWKEAVTEEKNGSLTCVWIPLMAQGAAPGNTPLICKTFHINNKSALPDFA